MIQLSNISNSNNYGRFLNIQNQVVKQIDLDFLLANNKSRCHICNPFQFRSILTIRTPVQASSISFVFLYVLKPLLWSFVQF